MSKRGRSFFGNVLLSIVLFAICFIPLWIYLLARALLESQGFWQNLILTGIAAYLLGAAQFFLLLGLVFLLLAIWLDE